MRLVYVLLYTIPSETLSNCPMPISLGRQHNIGQEVPK